MKALCDVVVSALILDTPEAAATLGVMSRFGGRIDSKNSGSDAGCLICHAPTSKYDCAPQELTEDERCTRNLTEAQLLRETGSKAALKRQGV